MDELLIFRASMAFMIYLAVLAFFRLARRLLRLNTVFPLYIDLAAVGVLGFLIGLARGKEGVPAAAAGLTFCVVALVIWNFYPRKAEKTYGGRR